MSLADLTRQSVEAALAEATALGGSEFLKQYGFGSARDYFVLWNGARYDSKAIAGVAHGYLPGKFPLVREDFSGGEGSVARRLRQLGFEVPKKGERNPSWTRDELILALDLYARFNGKPPGKGSAEINGLSAILNQIPRSTGEGRPDFRNSNGVYRTLMHFKRFDPAYRTHSCSHDRSPGARSWLLQMSKT